jgi:hypothetical protein
MLIRSHNMSFSWELTVSEMKPSSGIHLLVSEILYYSVYILGGGHEQIHGFYVRFGRSVCCDEVNRCGWATQPTVSSGNPYHSTNRLHSLVTRSERTSFSFKLAPKSRLACSSTTRTFHCPGATFVMASRNPNKAYVENGYHKH